MIPFYHSCTKCGAEYNESEWDALPGAAGGREIELAPGLLLEYRNCPCNGTMAADPLPMVLSLMEVES